MQLQLTEHYLSPKIFPPLDISQPMQPVLSLLVNPARPSQLSYADHDDIDLLEAISNPVSLSSSLPS